MSDSLSRSQRVARLQRCTVQPGSTLVITSVVMKLSPDARSAMRHSRTSLLLDYCSTNNDEKPETVQIGTFFAVQSQNMHIKITLDPGTQYTFYAKGAQ